MLAHWTLPNLRLTCRVAPELTHAIAHPPNSYAFCCTHCGEVWARRTVVDDSGAIQPWFFWTVPCEACPGGLLVPGSILLWRDEEYFRNLPNELLVREFLLHTKDLAHACPVSNS